VPKIGAVLIEWETVYEIDTMGFNLYRSESAGGPWTLLNKNLIPSLSPGGGAGAAYAWLDGNLEPGITYFYRLEEVDIHGRRTLFGPVTAAALPNLMHDIYLPLVMANR
jgi:hypothetical protein